MYEKFKIIGPTISGHTHLEGKALYLKRRATITFYHHPSVDVVICHDPVDHDVTWLFPLSSVQELVQVDHSDSGY